VRGDGTSDRRPIRLRRDLFSKTEVSSQRQRVVDDRAATAAQGDEGFLATCIGDRAPVPLTQDRRALAIRYVPMARQLARRVCKTWPNAQDELQSTACLALVEAARGFDASRGIGFGAYARHRIRGALRDLERLFSSDGRQRSGQRPSSPGVSVFEEHNAAAIAIEPARLIGAPARVANAVERWLSRLPKAHAVACRLIYVHGKSPDEAAAEVGCSRSFLFRLHREAVLRLIAEDGHKNPAE
jgi:RNA polymerase sigma factor (sigma-70 family)